MELTKQNLLDSLWVEKYRPRELQAMALPEITREKFEGYVKEKNIPNLLFSGSAGSGKTTIAKILLEKLDCDWEIMNASSDRGIEVVRGRIRNFAKMATLSHMKVLLLDEADHVTPDAQAALRATMEEFSKSTRFILTCNYPTRIIDPLHSRCQHFQFSAYPKDQMLTVLKNIMDREHMSYAEDDLKKHIEEYYPDLRKCINEMQKNIRSGKFAFTAKQDLCKAIVELMLKKDLLGLRTRLINDMPDFEELYRFTYDNISLFPQKARLTVLLEAAEYLYRDNIIVDKEMNFVAFCIQVFKAL